MKIRMKFTPEDDAKMMRATGQDCNNYLLARLLTALIRLGNTTGKGYTMVVRNLEGTKHYTVHNREEIVNAYEDSLGFALPDDLKEVFYLWILGYEFETLEEWRKAHKNKAFL